MMAKFVINNLVYDTEKMEFITKVEKIYPCEESLIDKVLYWGQSYRWYKCDLYQSKNGRFLLTHTGNSGTIYGEAIDEEEAKKLLLNSNYDVYVHLFGELEEA